MLLLLYIKQSHASQKDDVISYFTQPASKPDTMKVMKCAINKEDTS